MKKWLVVIGVLIILALGIVFIKSQLRSELNKPNKKGKMELQSNFEDGTIPSKYTCDGENVNPPLQLEDIPENAESLVLIVDDPDAPGQTFTHWVLFNFMTEKIGEDSVPSQALQGKNDFGNSEYGGPCPPSGEHRYQFKLYALDQELDLEEGSSKEEVEEAIEGHVLDEAMLVGKYSRE